MQNGCTESALPWDVLADGCADRASSGTDMPIELRRDGRADRVMPETDVPIEPRRGSVGKLRRKIGRLGDMCQC